MQVFNPISGICLAIVACLGCYAQEGVNVKTFGVVGDDVTDDRAAIQRALDSAAAGVRAYFPPGRYRVVGSLTISKPDVLLIGAGWNQSYIRFEPTANNQALLYFYAIPSFVAGGGVEDIGLLLTPRAYTGAIAISVRNTSFQRIKQVKIWDWCDASDSSIAIQTQGREWLTIDTVLVRADRPLLIKEDPEMVNKAGLDGDYLRVYQAAFSQAGKATRPVIEIEDGVTLTNADFRGINLTDGSYGIYWRDTKARYVSHNLNFENIRWEGDSAARSGYLLYFDRSGPKNISHLTLHNITARTAVATNGIYLRKVNGGECINCSFTYEAPAVSVDINPTVTNFLFNLSSIAVGLTKGQSLR